MHLLSILLLQNQEEEWNKKLLNTMATQTLDAVTDLEKDGKLTEEQSQQYLDRIRKDVQAAKEKYEINRAYQQAALHKRLTQLKKEKLVAKVCLGFFYTQLKAADIVIYNFVFFCFCSITIYEHET